MYGTSVKRSLGRSKTQKFVASKLRPDLAATNRSGNSLFQTSTDSAILVSLNIPPCQLLPQNGLSVLATNFSVSDRPGEENFLVVKIGKCGT